MSRVLVVISFLILFFSCDKERNEGKVSVTYELSFPTEPDPIAVAADKLNETVYVANFHNSKTNYSAKVQKFDRNGVLVSTIIDFATFHSKFPKYDPIDICFDTTELYILVKPYQLNGDLLVPLKGFCVLRFTSVDLLRGERNFSNFYFEGHPTSLSIAFYSNQIHVTDGFLLKKIAIWATYWFEDVILQTINDKPDSSTYSLVTDMAINSEGIIYLTGPGNPEKIDSINTDFSGCYITKIINPYKSQFQTFYSRSRTGINAADTNNPGIAVSDLGNIYVVTCYGMSLEIFDKNNDLILIRDLKPIAGEMTRPIDVALDNSRIYILDNRYNNVVVLHYNEK